jgi:hypothetical protein
MSTLIDVINKLKEIKKEYGKKYNRIFFDMDYSYSGYEHDTLTIVGEREETDAEYEERAKRSKKVGRQKLKNEKKIYEELKNKFEKFKHL